MCSNNVCMYPCVHVCVYSMFRRHRMHSCGIILYVFVATIKRTMHFKWIKNEYWRTATATTTISKRRKWQHTLIWIYYNIHSILNKKNIISSYFVWKKTIQRPQHIWMGKQRKERKKAIRAFFSSSLLYLNIWCKQNSYTNSMWVGCRRMAFYMHAFMLHTHTYGWIGSHTFRCIFRKMVYMCSNANMRSRQQSQHMCLGFKLLHCFTMCLFGCVCMWVRVILDSMAIHMRLKSFFS